MDKGKVLRVVALAPHCVIASQALAAEVTETSASTTLEEIVVQGRQIENYRATDALTGTKTNTLLKDLPLSVSIVSQQLIEDRAISRLSEALDSVAGAQRKQGYGGVENFGAFLRGFDSSFLTLRNGTRDFGFYSVRDPANVERFEVLKGPGSVLYGAVYPGGITNIITKKPVDDRLAEVNLIAGSSNLYRGEVDLGGPIGESVFYRLNAAYEDSDSFRDHVGNEALFLAPVVTWLISDDTSLTVEFERKKSEYTWDIGLPRSPLAFEVPTSRFLGEPDGINKVDTSYIASRLEHRFNSSWKFQQQLSYSKTDGNYKLRSFYSIADDNRTVNRVAYDTWEKSDTKVVQHELVGTLDALNSRHSLVFGAEYYETEQSYSFPFASLASIDLFEPVYGAQPEPGGFILFADQNNSRGTGYYVQDMISIDEQWKVLAGLRYDEVKNSTKNLLNDQHSSRAPDRATSHQFGVVYQPDEDISLYASYGESFLSITSGRTAGGEDLKPESGKQVELGIKHSWFDGTLSTSLALFDIVRENVSTPDPVMPTFRVQTAEQSSRGAEVEIHGSILPGWSVAFSTAYINAEVSRDNTFAVGSSLPGAPEYSASLWSKYTIQSGPLPGLEIGGGIYYVDARAVALPNPAFELPSYTRVDAMIGYQFDDWRWQLNIKNLLDKDIYDLTSTTIMPQEPRSFSLQLGYSFW